MSESSAETGQTDQTGRTDPTDTPHGSLGALDPDQFVGEPPAGDDSPGEFMSRDQQPAGQPGEEDA